MDKKALWLNILMLLTIGVLSSSCCGGCIIERDFLVYRPAPIDDGLPPAEVSDLYQMVANEQLNMYQRTTFEKLFFGRGIQKPVDGKTEDLARPHSDIIGSAIKDLDFFSKFGVISDAWSIRFYSTRLEDISGLLVFRDLRGLVIRGSELKSFEVLANFPNLETLDISYSRATSLESLKDCISLRSLTIDDESNFSIEPIRHLRKRHLNHRGEVIALKIHYVKNRLRDIPVHPYFGEKELKVEGHYKLDKLSFKIGEKGDYLFASDKEVSGELTLNNGNFVWSLVVPDASAIDFTRSGTYQEIHNLIYFTDEVTKETWYASFEWDWYTGDFEITERRIDKGETLRFYSFKKNNPK